MPASEAAWHAGQRSPFFLALLWITANLVTARSRRDAIPNPMSSVNSARSRHGKSTGQKSAVAPASRYGRPFIQENAAQSGRALRHADLGRTTAAPVAKGLPFGGIEVGRLSVSQPQGNGSAAIRSERIRCFRQHWPRRQRRFRQRIEAEQETAGKRQRHAPDCSEFPRPWPLRPKRRRDTIPSLFPGWFGGPAAPSNVHAHGGSACTQPSPAHFSPDALLSLDPPGIRSRRLRDISGFPRRRDSPSQRARSGRVRYSAPSARSLSYLA